MFRRERIELPRGPTLEAARREGQGPVWVYLHGLGCAGSLDWPPVAKAPALAGRASLWVDLPGFGLTARPPDFESDLDVLGRLLAGALVREPLPVALVGHSMGGTLALRVAEELVALGHPPHALFLAEPNLRAEDATGSAMAAAMRREDFVAGWEAWCSGSSSEAYRASLRQSDPVTFHQSASSLVRVGRGLLPRFAALGVARKGYVLGGRSDAATRETARLVAEAGIRVVTVAESGHGFSEEDPEGLGRALAELLTGA
ncbi:alpha/beta hydrolase [Corallococcus sp. M34]|uniref:alpha/beta fold hydrolase n=1 Tax=Citreicoccus inhibens TaxID=2849499 RepID=UPI001C2509C1|nr:alpha/beta hydrolase [Citreicoccus inhibens]MBU8895236.1 alpha/beta hydrolase [Citreicoccus inhibens]